MGAVLFPIRGQKLTDRKFFSPNVPVGTLNKPHRQAAIEILEGGDLPKDKVDFVVETVTCDVLRPVGSSLGSAPGLLRGYRGNRLVLALLTRNPRKN